MPSLRMRCLVPCIALGLAWAGGARAGIALEIFEDSNGPFIVSSTGTSIDVDPSAPGLATAAPDFTFNAFGGSATLGTGTLTATGSILSKSASQHTLTILISDNAFPSTGSSYLMASSSSYSYLGFAPASFTYQSFASAGSTLFAMTVPSPGSTYSPLATSPPTSSGSSDEANTPFNTALGYTLTESYQWVSMGSGATFQPTGSTVVSAQPVPEPSSLALVGLGSLGWVVIRRRRRA